MAVLSFLLLMSLAGGIDCFGNITRFLTLIPGQTVQNGPVDIEISKSTSAHLMNSLISSTRTNNKFTMDSSFSVGGILKAFKLGASVSVGIEHWTTQSTESTKSFEKEVVDSIVRKYEVKNDEVFLAAAEMKMFSYLDSEGHRKRMVLSTGTLYVGVYNAGSFKNVVLDDTFEILANKWKLKTYTHQQLLDSATNVHVVNIPFPAPDTYYRIFNKEYPGARLGKWSSNDHHIGCDQWADAEDQFWKFVKYESGPGYLIYNKKYTHDRLYANQQGLGSYEGRRFPDQVWMVRRVGGNAVRLTNKANGHKLGMWAPTKCGAGDWDEAQDQVWILEPDSNANCFVKKNIC